MKSTDKLLALAEKFEKKAIGNSDIESASNRVNNAIGLSETLYDALDNKYDITHHTMKLMVKRIIEELMTAQHSLKPIHDDLG